MSFDDAINAATAVWFDTEMGAVAITYNGKNILAHVSYGEDREGASVFEVMDLEVQVSDVPEHNYRDVAVVDDATWYLWKRIAQDAASKTLRFRRDERPVL